MNFWKYIVALIVGGYSTICYPEDNIFFETKVRQIFSKRCVSCHGSKTAKAKLRLDSPAALIKGSETGPVVQAGKPEQSLLFELIVEGEMPPKGNDQLTNEEVAIVKAWIESGTKFRDHSTLPQVTDRRISALMLLRCTACHGAQKQEGGLDLRTVDSMVKGGKSGSAVVSGNAADSLLVKRIHAEEMPPRRLLVQASVKPMEASELAMLEQWINDGMLRSIEPVDAATYEPDPLVSDDDRKFWSFQSPRAAKPPQTPHASIARNAIDSFIHRKLNQEGLQPVPEADRLILLRRVYFDLLGLPPAPEVVLEFLSDDDPLAYERLVDQLLASPNYGERWGRHWLDAAGYADSEGAQNEDRERKHIWRYRDYVIRAFNADKPYDRFLHEQIAGDELADYENGKVIDETLYDNLVATGFLRTAPDRTFANITNFVPDRLEVIADEIQILSSSVLGLTMNCARCHTHKFDPIPQRDYYRLAAALKDGYDEHDWLKSQGPRTLPYVLSTERSAWQAHEQAIDQQTKSLQTKLASEKDEAVKKQIDEQIKRLVATRKPEPRIRGLWSRGRPSPTFVLLRGNYLTPGHEVGPGVPSVLTDGRSPFETSSFESKNKSGRRLALAHWLTRPDHPLTARVLVNRVWKHHFGRGLVKTLDNFGVTGDRPTHPELLDWLAVNLVRRNWSIKDLHRLIVTSSTYRQTSHAKHDDKLLSCMPMVRIEGEAVRDALISVAGMLDQRPFGPPDRVDVRADGLITAQKSNGGWRRSIYVLQRRTKIPTILENFDFPQMGPNCVQRDQAIVAPQALHLLNNATVHELAERFAERVERLAGTDRKQQIGYTYLIAFGRRPTKEEVALGQKVLLSFEKKWSETENADPVFSARRALSNYVHAIMNSAEFVYID